MNGYCLSGKCMCASGYDGDACETPMYSEIFMDGELPMLGEGEDGWVNGPDWNNAGSLTPRDGEAFTPAGDTYFSDNTIDF